MHKHKTASSNAMPIMSAFRGAGSQGAISRAQHHACTRSRHSTGLTAWLRAHGYAAHALDTTLANQTTPLMHAARLGELDIVSELVALGVALDLRNDDGNNALWLACFSNNLAVIDALLDAGIDIDNVNDNGATCLMYAASAGKAEVVQRLLAAGADPRRESLDGFTALDMAATIECLRLLHNATRSSIVGAATDGAA